jgi:glucose-1-phosphate thymidylyltransferase
MKVIIPAGGYGTRMRPHTHTRPKPMVPVAGRPSLAFILDALKPLPVEEVIVITGKMGEQMEEYVAKYYDFKTRFIEQKVMRGQADAIALAEQYVQGDLMTIFVDTLFDADLSVVTDLPNADGVMFVAEVPDPSRFGIAVEGPDGYVTRVVEKPQDPVSNLALVGIYYFKDSQQLFRAIHKLMDSGRNRSGEYFLSDTVQVMIDDGAKFITAPVRVWEDTGTPDAVLHSNRYLLRGMDKHTEPYMHGTSLVVPPSYISPEATVEQSVIGPYASISEGAIVRDSIVKNSIVSAKAKITAAALFGAIIGEGAVVEGSYQALNIGDSSQTHVVSASAAEIDETFK